jgi:hypothetical protein
MTALERLQAIAATLPPDAVDVLVAVAERMSPAPDFEACLASLPEEEVDSTTAAELAAARREAEGSPALTLEEIRQESRPCCPAACAIPM